jgi:alkylhydroperoxidase family enzyme
MVGFPTESNMDLLEVLAITLERLTARVTRDLDVDAGEGVLPEDPVWAETIARVAAYARECAEVLDEPRLAAVLAAQSSCGHAS